MKILCISKYAAIPEYGTHLRHYSLCKEWVKNGHEVVLVSSNSHITPNIPAYTGPFMEEYRDGVRIIWLKMPEYHKTSSAMRVFSWFLFEYKILYYCKSLHLEKPDVVYCSSLSLLSVFSGLYFKSKYHAKFVFEVRDIWPMSLLDLTSISKYHPFVLFLSYMERLAYKKADLLIGTMPGLHLHVAKVIKKQVNCICIPQGVDEDFYKNNKMLNREFIEKYIPVHKFTVTYAGNLTKSFALDVVIETAKRLTKEAPDIHFLFLGDGDMKFEYQKQAKGLDNITFVPKVSKEYVLDFLKRSSLLLHSLRMKPSLEYGLSPNKFIDYMYSGRPIIVLFSGYPSLINEAGCGEFIPAEKAEILCDKLIEYSKMPVKELDKMGAKGKTFLIENMTFSKLADRLMNEMLKLTDEKQ